jgi:hypothetical protein
MKDSISPAQAPERVASAGTFLPPPQPMIVQLAQLVARDGTPFRKAPPRGYLRGIDVYSATQFPAVFGTVSKVFHAIHGRWPDIVNPQLLSDKIFWSMFFRRLKVPETGNKLLTSSLIPEDARALVSGTPIVWHSKVPRIPRAGEVEPGAYYLKTSHGADMYRRVTYPISEAEAEALDREFGQHLSTKYGFQNGEWWYSAFTPEILLERAIGSTEFSVSWNLLVIDGEVVRITAYQKVGFRRFRLSRLSPDFTPITPPGAEGAADYVMPSESTRQTLLSAASAIGKPLRFARIDFLLDDEERVYLGEVTFVPGASLSRLPEDLDLSLGAKWGLRGEF